MTQEQFAELIGVTRCRLSIWEAEIDEFHPSYQSYETLKALAESEGILVDRLIDDPRSYSDAYTEFVAGNYEKKIQYIRAAYGVTQSEFGYVVGCEGNSACCTWESGQRKPLREHFGRIRFLAEAKGIDLAKLNEAPDFYQDAYSKFIEVDSGKKIRFIHLTYGVYTDVFGEMLGCSGNAVCTWERGQCIMGRQYYNALSELAAEKGISMDELNQDPTLYEDPYDSFCDSDCHQKIRFIRLTLGMTVYQFASEAEVSNAMVNAWEGSSGKKRRPGRESFRKICDCLDQAGISLDYIEKNYKSFFESYEIYRSPGYGQRIKKLRAAANLKRADFARAIGVRDQTVRVWEREAFRRGVCAFPGEQSFYRM